MRELYSPWTEQGKAVAGVLKTTFYYVHLFFLFVPKVYKNIRNLTGVLGAPSRINGLQSICSSKNIGYFPIATRKLSAIIAT